MSCVYIFLETLGHADSLVECLNNNNPTSLRSQLQNNERVHIRRNTKMNSKLSFNQQSHYLTIVMVGFYFIMSTIPYSVILSLQNNLTLHLNYSLHGKNAYLKDPLWIKFGSLREWVAIFRVVFMSNHCFNFFLYLLFNRMFRKIVFDFVKNGVNSIKLSALRKETSTV